MIAVDTNVLIYAHREESPQHEAAGFWLSHLAEGATAWALPVFCLGEFVRVVTHPRVFEPPTELDVAIKALEGLLASPSVKVLSPGATYARVYASCVRDGDARGNLAFDAQIAAVCREQGATRLLTADRDFARFKGLTLVALNETPSSG